MSYTIFMSEDGLKRLVTAKKVNLYKGENLVDVVEFLVPEFYRDFDLKEFTCSIIYKNPKGTVKTELLDYDEELYKEKYLRCILPVTTEINVYSGSIELFLQFQKNDEENSNIYVLKTMPTKIEIMTAHDYYSSIDKSSLDFVTKAISELDERIGEMGAIADILDKKKADDICINDEGEVQLKSNGDLIGNSINVATVEIVDSDEDMDGILDITGKYDEIEID